MPFFKGPEFSNQFFANSLTTLNFKGLSKKLFEFLLY